MLGPLASQESLHRVTALCELAAIAPGRILAVGKRYSLGVARVPQVLCALDFQQCRFMVEGRFDLFSHDVTPG